MRKAFIILFLTFLSSCQTTGGVKATDSPPKWVAGEPRVEGMICAVGTSEPTFYEEDAKQYAADNARKELARTISIEVKTIMVDFATEKGGSVNEATVMQVSSWATSAVVKNSKIMEYWFDAESRVSQKKKITYALCCMPRKFDKNTLERQLINSHYSNNISHEEISRTAEEIVNKLENKQ